MQSTCYKLRVVRFQSVLIHLCTVNDNTNIYGFCRFYFRKENVENPNASRTKPEQIYDIYSAENSAKPTKKRPLKLKVVIVW